MQFQEMIASVAKQATHSLSAFKSSSVLLKAGFAVLIAGGLISLSGTIFRLFLLNGANLVTLELWRLLTHLIIEPNILVLVWSLCSFQRAVALLEPAWGALELLRFLCVVQIGTSLSIVIASFVVFTVFENDMFFFHTNVYGSLSACAAIYVAIKQYLPDFVVLVTPVGRIKNTHLPALTIFVSICMICINVLRSIAILQLLLGIQIAWLYLRFLQPHDEGMLRGDSGDHFAWHTLFPSKLQPLMKIISSALFSFLVSIRLCKPIANPISISELHSVNILPNLQTKDTERRRQKALRDLTARLNRAQQTETEMWPEMEDVDEDSVIVSQCEDEPLVPHVHSVITNKSDDDTQSTEISVTTE